MLEAAEDSSSSSAGRQQSALPGTPADGAGMGVLQLPQQESPFPVVFEREEEVQQWRAAACSEQQARRVVLC